MKTSTIVAVLVVLLVVLGGWYASGIRPFNKAPGPVACTAEAMQCPDGSYVGRSGPNCEFVCPTATTTSVGGTAADDNGIGDASVPPGGGGGAIAPYHSGIRGTVMAGPTCPVERNPPDPQCADRPLSTTVAVFRKTNTVTPFATTKSDAQGKFEFSLPPGDYVVGAGESSLPRCAQTPVTVGSNVYTQIVEQCDTGIR